MSGIRIGAERLRDNPALIDSARAGLITNYTGVTSDLCATASALLDAGVPVQTLFGPEHGLRGTTQAGESEAAEYDPDTGLPLVDTYGSNGSELDRLIAESGVDMLLYDLQDIGCRFYTYVWTMYDMLASAARLGLPFVVLDRPNPLGGKAVEGPLLDPAFASFVGRAAIPLRHGLTVGELAQQLNREAIPAQTGRHAELQVITMDGWHRDSLADETGLAWVMPSVNIPTLDSALAYVGTGLFEGTNLSEGRGTTRPFELIGAPYVDKRWARALNASGLNGVRFRDVSFEPTFHKYAGATVHGVQLHVDDRAAFEPVRCALVMLASLRQLYPDDFDWRRSDTGAAYSRSRYFIDVLWGSDRLRHMVDAGQDPELLLREAPTDLCWAGPHAQLYPDIGSEVA